MTLAARSSSSSSSSLIRLSSSHQKLPACLLTCFLSLLFFCHQHHLPGVPSRHVAVATGVKGWMKEQVPSLFPLPSSSRCLPLPQPRPPQGGGIRRFPPRKRTTCRFPSWPPNRQAQPIKSQAEIWRVTFNTFPGSVSLAEARMHIYDVLHVRD